MHPESGQRLPGDWIDATGDDEAMRLVRDLKTGAKCEVWLQTRLVGIVAPVPTPVEGQTERIR